ncbi:small ribosomal subunit protein mL103 (rPPR7)-like [Magnolia sinica]|uniref:small ribosomal subunit protein mL103 (rPPR7)-like n=1 Tax=Magnolia sinica TaxID=86752 RepID=UPI002659F290|nr:small ribosomal subunit protein mL103 (rPPR7)-like [Magnolia sinica]XP_058090362.1 small ribosomal subunit protein mL103 (rPPR7)-like [Magnolia sinica]XP_058090363.1 small ribosomal subunit protein mL103 (rPPR7)-like [Magnolia sinica]XP_058090364.1 small ribosomal subunit protein mL103 (rPPR7)-like [Magnolia sinica]
MTFLPLSSRHRLLLHFRLFSTTLSPSSPPISLSSAKSKLRSVHDPDEALSIFSSISNPTRISSCYALDLTVKRLSRARRFSDVQSLIESQKAHPNPHIPEEPFISTLILSYGRAGMLDHAIRTFDQMDAPRSAVSFNALLSACAASKNSSQIPKLFSEVPQKYGIVPDKVSYGILIRSLCELGSPASAVSVLKEMEEKKIEITTVTYTTVLSGFYKEGKVEEAERVWNEMRDRGCPLDAAVYNVKIMWAADHGKPEEVVKLMDEMVLSGLKPDTISYNYLMICHCKNGGIEDAKKVYQGLKVNKCLPNVTTFKTMVHYLCESGDFDEALKVCKASIWRKKIPDFGTVKRLVEGLVKNSKLKKAKELIGEVKKSFPDGSLNAWKKVEIEFGLNGEEMESAQTSA